MSLFVFLNRNNNNILMSKFAIKCRKGKLVYPAVMAVGMLVV